MRTLDARFEKRVSEAFCVRVDLAAPVGSFSVTALFGPSGSGKSTILRCLAGLERPDGGRIAYGEETWHDSATGVSRSPAERRVGFLTQDYALFPHLTVERNVGYGLRRLAREERTRRVRQMLERLGLAAIAGRRPARISGGEQQRVALARALVTEPRVMLLDEPLSALDAPLSERLRPELRRILAGFGAPAILVTHDRLDVIALADRVAVVDRGEVVQAGAVDEVFRRPADGRAAEILGVETIQPGRVRSIENGLANVEVGRASLTALAPPGGGGAAQRPGPPEADVLVCIRAEDVILERGRGAASSVRNRLPARVVGVEPAGATVRVMLDAGFPLTALVTRAALEELRIAPGEEVAALLKAPAVHLVRR
jgi:molybdate transport system ATP-binding protein